MTLTDEDNQWKCITSSLIISGHETPQLQFRHKVSLTMIMAPCKILLCFNRFLLLVHQWYTHALRRNLWMSSALRLNPLTRGAYRARGPWGLGRRLVHSCIGKLWLSACCEGVAILSSTEATTHIQSNCILRCGASHRLTSMPHQFNQTSFHRNLWKWFIFI